MEALRSVGTAESRKEAGGIQMDDVMKIFNSPEYVARQKASRKLAKQKEVTRRIVHDATIVISTVLVMTGIYFLFA